VKRKERQLVNHGYTNLKFWILSSAAEVVDSDCWQHSRDPTFMAQLCGRKERGKT